MRNYFLKIIFFLLIFLPISVFSQENIYNDNAELQLIVPADWRYENADNYISLYSKDNDLVIDIIIYETGTIGKLIELSKADLAKKFIDLKISNPSSDEMNGMQGWEFHGNAKNKEGLNISVNYGYYITTNYKVFELGIVAADDIIEKYKDDIKTVINNIKPI